MRLWGILFLSLFCVTNVVHAEDQEVSDEVPAPLTAEQIADIDAQIESLNITRAQVVAPEDNPYIDRRPEGVLSLPEVDSGLDQGE